MLMLKLLGDVLSAPVTGPVRGFEFILKALRDQVDAEMVDESKLQAELMQLGMRYQSGELTDAEYAAKEDAILEHMNEIRRNKEALAQEEAELTEGAVQQEPQAAEGAITQDTVQQEPNATESAVSNEGETTEYPAASEDASA